MIKPLKKLLAWWKNLLRDPVDESFALRDLELRIRRAFLNGSNATLNKDFDKAKEWQTEHARLYALWKVKAASYERRFFDPPYTNFDE